MLFGVGTDIVKISRIERAKPAFLRFAFTESELELLGSSSQSLAGNFAAKEAVAKAFGTGFRQFSLKDIEILREKSGKPTVNLYNKAAEFSHLKIEVSISHEKKYAVAYAVAEEVTENDCNDEQSNERGRKNGNGGTGRIFAYPYGKRRF